MSFYEEYLIYHNVDIEKLTKGITEKDVASVLIKSKLNKDDFLILLSPAAEAFLEEMAEKAHQLSIAYHGKSILLYTPIYISNHCINKCVYCSFNTDNKIQRKKLSVDEIEVEAQKIAESGLRHILVLTGESRHHTPISYIKEAVDVLKRYFESITLEVYTMDEDEYIELYNSGVEGLTIYQEVYDEKTYTNVHLSGPKSLYKYRLDAAERACRAKYRSVNIGALLGLNAWRKEAFLTGLHCEYLQKRFSDVELGVSLPRIRPHIGNYENIYPVSDKNLVQIMLALRLFMPCIGINISTRESQQLRDNLIPLGVTKMSAGVSTVVGGHSMPLQQNSQFEISDSRSVAEVMLAIAAKGYQPVLKDWVRL